MSSNSTNEKGLTIQEFCLTGETQFLPKPLPSRARRTKLQDSAKNNTSAFESKSDIRCRCLHNQAVKVLAPQRHVSESHSLWFFLTLPAPFLRKSIHGFKFAIFYTVLSRWRAFNCEKSSSPNVKPKARVVTVCRYTSPCFLC